MSKLPRPGQNNQPRPLAVLYIGTDTQQIEKSLKRIDRAHQLHIVQSVSDAMQLARDAFIDCAIIDQRNETNQSALMTASLAALATVDRIIVLANPENAATYEQLGPKCQVLTSPFKTFELTRYIFDGDTGIDAKQTARSRFKTLLDAIRKLKLPKIQFSRQVIPVVSFIYKNTALVLLASLFMIFLSYGVLISFFLLSDSWGTPMTLSSGNQLVIKAEQKMDDLRVKANLVRQRISREDREGQVAAREIDDAGVMAALVASTIDEEIIQRITRHRDFTTQIKSLSKIRREMNVNLNNSELARNLRSKYAKRLINRRSYNAGILGIMEAKHRAVEVDNEIARLKQQDAQLQSSLVMLESLRSHVQNKHSLSIPVAVNELMPLANEVITVKTRLKNARMKLASHTTRKKLLGDNLAIIEESIQSIENTPLGRAVKNSVVVMFVPYENSNSFKKGTALYSCSLGIVYCHKVGQTGEAINGETTAVHPFFGKTLRGSFVEALLDNPDAAKKEVLHAGRPPLFF